MSSSGIPLVSVLIPCYNAASLIGETLDSVLRQTWPNLEIIVVDDGSEDDSVAVVERLESSRVRLVRQSNAGAATARNRALAESNGDLIQYLDADDLLSPRKIELQVDRLTNRVDCIASAEWARFYRSPDEAAFLRDDTWQDLPPVEWLVRAWEQGGGMLFPALWLVPRPIVRSVGPWREDLSLNDDGEYFTRVVLASKQVLFADEARTYYRSGIEGSLSGLKSRKGWDSQFTAVALCESYLIAREDSDRTRRVCSMLWQRFAHASYPYYATLANKALERAGKLHGARLTPGGGHAFRVVASLLGWKAARVLQRISGRP